MHCPVRTSHNLAERSSDPEKQVKTISVTAVVTGSTYMSVYRRLNMYKPSGPHTENETNITNNASTPIPDMVCMKEDKTGYTQNNPYECATGRNYCAIM